MTQLTEEPIRYRDNPAGIIVSVLLSITVLVVLVTSAILLAQQFPIHFATGGSCYMVAHQSVCK